MIVVASKQAIRVKYQADANNVQDAIDALGPVLDASGMGAKQIRDAIDQRDPSRSVPVCLIGGYDIVPAFKPPNPTVKFVHDPDEDVTSDAPYGARPDDPAEVYLPTRAVSRIPDSGVPDAGQFIDILNRAAAAPGVPTPPGCFHLAANEFLGSAQLVMAVPTLNVGLNLSPPVPNSLPPVQGEIAGKGRIHFLLHGADEPARWDRLFGAANRKSLLVPAVRVSDLKGFALKGSIVTFSTCYSAMLDPRSGQRRNPDNQPALACLVAGAKTVYGSTRANWIDDTPPFDSFGSALIAAVWQLLVQGKPAAEALRQARFDFAESSLARDAWTRPYVLKTLLQAQCYGHPMARLQ